MDNKTYNILKILKRRNLNKSLWNLDIKMLVLTCILLLTLGMGLFRKKNYIMLMEDENFFFSSFAETKISEVRVGTD